MSAVDLSNPHQFSYDPESGVCYRTLDFMGFPGYRVGDDGSVWSRRTSDRWKFGVSNNWRRLADKINSGGRLVVILCRPKPAKQKTFFTHTLVLLAFVGPCPDGMECCHFPDRDPFNNCLYNLRWDTRKANKADQIIHGTRPRGETQGNSKLTEVQVRAIRSEYAAGGILQRELAVKYNTHLENISFIIRRVSWKHVV